MLARVPYSARLARRRAAHTGVGSARAASQPEFGTREAPRLGWCAASHPSFKEHHAWARTTPSSRSPAAAASSTRSTTAPAACSSTACCSPRSGYPTDYGFFENTLGEDGDPLDVLVLLDFDLVPRRAASSVRPVGVLKMSDEAGGDDKVVAVLGKDPRWSHIQDVDDIPEYTRKEIEHFFEHYKDLEPSKWVKVDEWGGRGRGRAPARRGDRPLQGARGPDRDAG